MVAECLGWVGNGCNAPIIAIRRLGSIARKRSVVQVGPFDRALERLPVGITAQRRAVQDSRHAEANACCSDLPIDENLR